MNLPPAPGPPNAPPKRPQWQVILAVVATVLGGLFVAVPLVMGLLALVFYGLVWLACSRH